MFAKLLGLFFIIGLVLFIYNRYMINNTINNLKSLQITPKKLGIIDKTTIAKGVQEMAKSKVVVTGLIRNGSTIFDSMKTKLEQLCKHFGEYKILIVENDSTDDTRLKLLNWAQNDKRVIILGCGVNSKECVLNLPRTIEHSPDRDRIAKMAYLRNLYIDYITKYLSNYDYLLTTDLDIEGNIFSDGLADTFHKFRDNDQIDSISANGVDLNFRFNNFDVRHYYDSFAIKFLGDKIGFDTMKEKIAHDNDITQKFKPRLGDDLVKVKSAFGGLAIYRIPSIIKRKSKYDYSKTLLACEHEFFNQSLPNNYVNPNMIVLVIDNDLL